MSAPAEVFVDVMAGLMASILRISGGQTPGRDRTVMAAPPGLSGCRRLQCRQEFTPWLESGANVSWPLCRMAEDEESDESG